MFMYNQIIDALYDGLKLRDETRQLISLTRASSLSPLLTCHLEIEAACSEAEFFEILPQFPNFLALKDVIIFKHVPEDHECLRLQPEPFRDETGNVIDGPY